MVAFRTTLIVVTDDLAVPNPTLASEDLAILTGLSSVSDMTAFFQFNTEKGKFSTPKGKRTRKEIF